MGLWVKEWLREYFLDLPHRPRELVHVQEFRHKGLHDWHMRGLVACISFFLQTACWLFGIGIIMLTRKMNPILNLVMEALFGLWTLLTFAAAIFPTFSSHCPFKSPLARVVYRIRHLHFFTFEGGHLAWKKFETLVDRERRKAREQSCNLEVKALKYVHAEYWGHEKLKKVGRCFKDVKEREEAIRGIEDLVAEWFNQGRSTMIEEAHAGLLDMPTEDSVLHLVRTWCELKGQYALNEIEEGAKNKEAWKFFTRDIREDESGDNQSLRGVIQRAFGACRGRRSQEPSVE